MVVSLAVAVLPDSRGQASLRSAMKAAAPLPDGARVRIRLGRARWVLDSEIIWLAEWLRYADRVEIEADHPDAAAQLRAALSRSFAGTAVTR